MADFEAGLGTLTRLGDTRLDVALVVVEPMAKSIEVGVRAARYAEGRSTDEVIVVANRVRGDDDEAAVRAAFPDREVVVVPDDDVVREADRRGVAPLDLDPASPAVEALAALARRLNG